VNEQLMELADRCEKAMGPDRELDEAILKAGWATGNKRTDLGPRFTASLDAAMQLVPDGWFWTAMNARDGKEKPIVGQGLAIVASPDDLHAREPSEAATPALALCAAALRARAQSENLGGGE
jgi:hypothetical protein